MKKFITLCLLMLTMACTPTNTSPSSSVTETTNKEEPASAKESSIDNQKEDIGKYIYVDSRKVAHIKLKCSAISSTYDFYFEGSASKYNYGIKRVLVESLTRGDIEKCCSYCVTDSIYEVLCALAQ